MATQKDIALNIKVKFEGANTVQELEDVLKEINKEMDDVEEGSHAFAILKNTASKATDEIQELNAKIKDLNGEAKTVKGGMDGLKGSTELVTQANGKLASSFDDVTSNGGAIAVLDSLTGGLATKIKDAYEASKLFNFSLKGMKTALISTGIGAFVVLLGLAVAYWDEIKDAIFKTTQRLKERVDLQRTINERLQGELGILDKQKELLELQGKSTEGITTEKIKQLKLLQESTKEEEKALRTLMQNKILQEQKWTLGERLKAMALTLYDIEGAAVQILKDRSGITDDVLEINKQLKANKSSQYDIEIELQKIDNDRRKTAEANTKAVKEEVEAREKIKGMTADEEFSKAISALQDYYADRKLIISQNFIDGLISESEYASQLSQLEDEHRQAELIALDDYGQDKTQKEQEIADKIIAIKKDENAKIAEANAQLKQDEEDAKTKEKEDYERLTQERIQLAQGLYQDLKALSQTFFDDTEEGQKKAFEFNKMVAIAETIVSTYLAAQKAYASQMSLATPDAPFRAAVAAGLAVASGLARIATIQRTQFNSTSPSGADGGGGNTPSNSTLQRQQSTTPNVPIIETGGEGQKIKVYVTETDIRNTTKKMTSIYSKAIVTE